MRLSDADIIDALNAGSLRIIPEPDHDQISGVSVDLHLSRRFRTFKAHTVGVIDCAHPAPAIAQVMSSEIETDTFYLHPGELALGATLEVVSLPDHLVGWLDGRSSLARLGLMVHITAHRIDPGWKGQIVLEFFNAGKIPLALQAGMAICAISFEQMTGPALRPYDQRPDARYIQQQGPVASRMGDHFISR